MSIEHILANFESDTESAWIAIDLAEELRQQGIISALWSAETPHPSLTKYGINVIRPYQGKAPASDQLTVVGTEVSIGSWYASTKFETVTLFNHQFSPSRFNRIMHRLTLQGRQQVALQYTNAQLEQKTGLPGSIVKLPFNPKRIFNADTYSARKSARFTLGRITADDLTYHHPDDIELYKKLIAAGVEIKIMGGTCLKPWLNSVENIELLPCELSMTGEFLPRFDCVYFNTPPTQVEGPSQAMMAAMHMKLPIVAFAGGGYATSANAYGQGFLFTNQIDAFNSIIQLSES